MSIATIVTRGYGSFGSVNFLPTLGYTVRIVVPTGRVEFTMPSDQCEFSVPLMRGFTIDRNRLEFTGLKP